MDPPVFLSLNYMYVSDWLIQKVYSTVVLYGSFANLAKFCGQSVKKINNGWTYNSKEVKDFGRGTSQKPAKWKSYNTTGL
jgi:hypothetical protein